jgi:Fe-S cluster assembly protein SufD
MTQVAENRPAGIAPSTAQGNGTHLVNFSCLEKQNGVMSHPWLDDLRKRSIARFEAVGFPTTKQEDWRQTSVAAIARTPFKLSGKPKDGSGLEHARRFSFTDQAACELVFVNGHYQPHLSRVGKLLRGVKVVSLASAMPTPQASEIGDYIGKLADINANPFVALNSGFINEGVFVRIPRGIHMEMPIHLLFLSTADGTEPGVSHPRVLVVAEDNTDFSFVESYVGEGNATYLTNTVTELIVGENCAVDHCKVQHETDEAYHVGTMQVKLGRSSTFVSHSASLGAKLARNDLNVVFAGEYAEATLNGLVLLDGTRHCDNHTLLDHALPNCPSHELYKHVLAGKSTGVFRGKILVRPDAQKTDSKQTSKSLLISDDAYMNSQPALEIYADDVKCTHGSTTGPVDEEMVFYLRSRGVGAEAARHLLTYAFAADITRRIRIAPVRRLLEDYMAQKAGLPKDLRITDLGHHDEASR